LSIKLLVGVGFGRCFQRAITFGQGKGSIQVDASLGQATAACFLQMTQGGECCQHQAFWGGSKIIPVLVVARIDAAQTFPANLIARNAWSSANEG
jgi:hypothetical protein